MEEDIAVIGLGLRFPGNATNPKELWQVLEKGESQWSEIPKDRLNVNGYYHPSGDRQGSISFRGAHFLKGDIGAFDATFFSIPSEDAKAIDPQQRMLLEVCYEALENAGLKKEDLSGSDTSVYVGSFVKDYEQICLRDPDWSPQYAATGNGIAIMANRISYFFNFHGPSMTVDTGCSGSLVSVHLGAQSLRNKESSIAIAAGAGLILTPSTMMPMTALNFLSPDGKCFTFDSRANGYGRGEGIGVVVMKRLSDTIRDNDTIRAVIRGSAVNQDGRTTGITLPSKEAQVANIRSVYKSAGLDFSQTAYVECHGTGTQAGDWRELRAISETLAADRSTEHPILVGSVKPNIGHLEGAAGVAGMIKGVLVLENAKIPPNINFQSGNPDIDFEGWKVKVPQSVTDWPVHGLRRVSINCFGFGGTNAHVILDEAPEYLRSRGLDGNHSSSNSLSRNETVKMDQNPAAVDKSQHEYHLFCYSSHEKIGVTRTMISHAEFIKPQQGTFSSEQLKNYSYTLACRRSALEWKSFIVARSATDLTAKLETSGASNIVRSLRKREPRICFLFCGQGAQWAKMGLDLMVFDVFRNSMEEACKYLTEVLQSPFNLLLEVFREESESAISYPHISQPATTALQVALIDLLKSLGVEPNFVVGHSSGEIAAAYAGGAISRSVAWEVAYFRGMAAISIPFRAPKLKGAMMVMGMSLEQAQFYLESSSKCAEVACVNSPQSVTISGRVESIQTIAKDLASKNIFHRILNVQTAYHSSHMRLVAHDYRDSLNTIECQELLPSVKMFSSVTGQALKGTELGAQYWSDNMVNPVQYVAAITTMLSLPPGERPDILVELGPRAALRSPTSEILTSIVDESSRPAYYSVVQPKGHGVLKLLGVIGELWIEGCPVRMEEVIKRGSDERLKCLPDLPPYPWNHSRTYWHESHLSVTNRHRQYGRQDLIGAPTADSIPFEPRWRGFLRVSENPWIQDHQVQKTIVYPAAGMISMVLEGAKQIIPDSERFVGYEIANMSISKAMIVPNTAHGLEVALNIKMSADIDQASSMGKSHEFVIYSKQLGHSWEQHASGEVLFRMAGNSSISPEQERESRREPPLQACNNPVNPRQLYEALDTIGMNYGPLFQNIFDVYKGNGACMCKVRVPNTKGKMPSNFEYPHILHPATLDSMFHSLFVIETLPMVPTFLDSLFVSANVGQEKSSIFEGFATAERVGIQGANANITMKSVGSGKAQVVIHGLHLTALTPSEPGVETTFLPNFRNLCTEIVWKEDATFSSSIDLIEQLDLFSHKHPALTVLQVGGSSHTAQEILELLGSADEITPRLSRFTLLDTERQDISADFLALAKGRRELQHCLECKSNFSDLNSDYHLIVSFGGEDADSLRNLLCAGGILLEYTPAHSHSAVGKGTEESQTEEVLDKHQLPQAPGLYRRHLNANNNLDSFQIILLTPNSPSDEIGSFSNLVRAYKTPSGQSYIVLEMTCEEILNHACLFDQSVVISLLEICRSHEHHNSIFSWDEFEFDVFKSIQKSAKGIIWISRAAHMNPHNPQGSPIIGLARTLMSEDPRKRIVTFDLDIGSSLSDTTLTENIMSIVGHTFGESSISQCPEVEYAEKGGKIFIPRLRLIKPLNQIIEGCSQDIVQSLPFHDDPLSDEKELCSRLFLLRPGLSADSWHFTKFQPPGILPDEVEIQFNQALLTSLDVDTALGRSVESTIGLDVHGTVLRVGKAVTAFRPGDKVTALVPNGSIQSKVRVKASLAQAYSQGPFPSLSISAYYALVCMGRASPRKTVLIHAGASAHGLVAIEVARLVGAKVFVTVIGPSAGEQRRILEECGLPSGAIFSADDDEFVADLSAATDGKGVDIVYSTTQDQLSGSAKCIKRCGIIVQLSSRTPYSAGSKVSLGSNAAIINFDLKQLLREDEEFAAQLFEKSSEFLKGGGCDNSISAAMTTDFGIDLLEEALNQIHQAPYQGLYTVSAHPEDNRHVQVVCAGQSRSLCDVVDPAGTYLLAGGLGGLGRSISDLLVTYGAKHLAFVSRSGISADQSRSFIASLQSRGVDVRVYCADICDETSLKDVIEKQISAEMPPLRGVFQCAAVIQDAVFDNMTYTNWNSAFKPKTLGSWNLVKAASNTGHNPFYVFLSSSAGVIGNRGQANYAAGNSFQDALAHHCRLQGKRAVSVDLGPVLGAGMLAEDEEILDMLRASGFYGIRHEDFLTVIKHAIMMEIGSSAVPTPAQIVMGVGTGGLLRQNKPADPYWSRTALYSYLNLIDMPPQNLSDVSNSQNRDMMTMLAQTTSVEAAADIVRAGLANMLAKAMNLLPEEIDVTKSPNAYGVDSLVAVGVRNWVLSNCRVEISVFEVLSNDTIDEMAKTIASRGDYGASKTQN